MTTPSNIGAFAIVVRMFCIVPLLTGLVDIIGGAWILGQAGAVLPSEISSDAVLNNQIAFWGAIWLGFGILLWWVSNDPLNRATVGRTVFIVLFMSGLARVYAWVRWGYPGPVLTGAMAIELVLSPALLFWLDQLLSRNRG